MPVFEDLKVFAGNAHPQLFTDICAYLGVSPGKIEVFKFSNDNTFVRILENKYQHLMSQIYFQFSSTLTMLFCKKILSQKKDKI